MAMDLITQLEALRIPDSSFFGIGEETQRAYQRANDMLDDCLEIVYKWMEDKRLESTII